MIICIIDIIMQLKRLKRHFDIASLLNQLLDTIARLTNHRKQTRRNKIRTDIELQLRQCKKKRRWRFSMISEISPSHTERLSRNIKDAQTSYHPRWKKHTYYKKKKSEEDFDTKYEVTDHRRKKDDIIIQARTLNGFS